VLAEGLFQDAKRLMAEGNFQEACPKLAESHRLDPAGGTALLLGSCHEGMKRWASAWAAYKEAVGFAIKDHRSDREERAKERLREVEARLGWLHLRVPGALQGASGLRVRVGALEIPEAAWTSPLPLDPGEHRVAADRPGCSWSGTVRIEESGGSVALALPEHLDCKATSGSAAPSGPSPSPAAYGLLGAGALGLGAGAVLGLRALSKDQEADRRCPGVSCDDVDAVRLSSEARRTARASNVSFALGATALFSGVLLVLFQRRERVVALRVAPSIGASGGLLSATGAF
jgi:serine/threonine-protein kinase